MDPDASHQDAGLDGPPVAFSIEMWWQRNLCGPRNHADGIVQLLTHRNGRPSNLSICEGFEYVAPSTEKIVPTRCRMKPRCNFLVLIALLMTLTPRASAAVVYDNGDPDHVGGIFSSTIYVYPTATTAVSLYQPLRFNGLNWWGFYPSAAPLPTTEAFLFSIYNPSGTLLETRQVGDISRNPISEVVAGSWASTGQWSEYAYAGSLATVDLPSGDYFFGISNTASPYFWVWGSTSHAPVSGVSYSYHYGPGWQLDPYTAALAFQATIVPEIDPTSFGSAVAAVLGFLGLLERRLLRRACNG